ncbi:hypothetical protein HDU97_006056 [Phlyctochytrium planicorne]|nr:hypothetical protein HDU97_006056 [Phlyctochytrium planicorne]
MTNSECNIIREAFPILGIPASKCCKEESIGCTNGTITAISAYFKRFETTLPAKLGDLSNLKNLVLSALGSAIYPNSMRWTGNFFLGPVPIEWSKLSNLRVLNLAANNIGGPLPPWLGNLTQLQRLDLSAANFTGPILVEWEKSFSITLKELFTGRVPTWTDDVERTIEGNCFMGDELPTRNVTLPNDFKQRSGAACKSYYDALKSAESPRSPPTALIVGVAIVAFLVFLAAVFGFIYFRRRIAAAKAKAKSQSDLELLQLYQFPKYQQDPMQGNNSI